jgi:hypothetical protein
MPEMKNLDQSTDFVNPIVDPNRKVNQRADAPPVGYRTTQPGKVLQKLDVTQQRTSKTLSGRGIIGANIGEQYL